MYRLLITVPIRPGSHDAVRGILHEGPPFELMDTTLERHTVFLSSDQLIFLFEGPHAEAEAGRMLEQPGVIDRAGRLGDHLASDPAIPEEVFEWERPERIDGLDFGPLPGPGDSDGGPID